MTSEDRTISPKQLWSSFSKAIGTELRPAQTIKGASGVEHHVEGISVSDKDKRIVVFSAESSPRNAALMRVDIQSTLEDVNVIVARPIGFDLVAFARQLTSSFGIDRLDLTTLAAAAEDKNGNGTVQAQLGSLFEPFAGAVRQAKIPPLKQIISIIEQASLLDWPQFFADVHRNPENIVLDFSQLLPIDSMALDRKLGICPIPFYEFGEGDWSHFGPSGDIDGAISKLKEMGVYQFFFPAPDQLVLGLADRGVNNKEIIDIAISRAPSIGHPLGSMEILPHNTDLASLIPVLKEAGLLVEGEFGISVSERGTEQRGTIKFRPRESVITRIANIFKININLSS